MIDTLLVMFDSLMDSLVEALKLPPLTDTLGAGGGGVEATQVVRQQDCCALTAGANYGACSWQASRGPTCRASRQRWRWRPHRWTGP